MLNKLYQCIYVDTQKLEEMDPRKGQNEIGFHQGRLRKQEEQIETSPQWQLHEFCLGDHYKILIKREFEYIELSKNNNNNNIM